MLTDKQKRFCEEFLIDLNATQAAIRAGYSENTAGSIGNENLMKPEIQLFIQERQKARSERVEVTADMVLRELMKLGFSDIKEYYEEGDKTMDVTKLDNRLTAAISSIKITETEGDWGSKTIKEFRLHDKLSALEKIAKHIGFFGKDNDQKKADPISPEVLAVLVDKINKNAAS